MTEHYKYFNYEVYLQENLFDENGEYYSKETLLDIQDCNETMLPGIEDFGKDFFKEFPNYKCLKNNSYPLSGSHHSINNRRLSITLKRCQDRYYCKSDSEINYQLHDSYIQVLTSYTYFDYQNMENPLRSLIDDTHFLELDPYKHSNYYIYLAKNEYTLYDNFYDTSTPTQTGIFYDIFKNNIGYKVKDTPWFARVQIRVSSKIYQYERRVYSFMDLTGQVGGLFELIEICLTLILGFISTRLLTYSMIKDLAKNKRSRRVQMLYSDNQPDINKEDFELDSGK